jgi:hypothetical protein
MSGGARKQGRVQGAWASSKADTAVKVSGKTSGVASSKNTIVSPATSWLQNGTAADGATALTFQPQVCYFELVLKSSSDCCYQIPFRFLHLLLSLLKDDLPVNHITWIQLRVWCSVDASCMESLESL